MHKYYDVKRKTLIDETKDICGFKEWMQNGINKYSACKHPDGFYVFLESDRIELSNEYEHGDPYTVCNTPQN